MQLMSCEFAAVRRPGPAAWSGPRPSLTTAARTKKLAGSPTLRPAAFRRDDAEFGCAGGGGKQVDEGMAVLRRRIHEIRAAERTWEEPPAGWAAREKEWYSSYDAAELVRALQALLVGAPPGVAVGLAAALVLAVPASAFVLISHLVDASQALVSNLPH